MQVKVSTLIKLRNWLFIIIGIAIGGVILSSLLQPQPEAASADDTTAVQTEGDNQVVNLTAKGGYSPRTIQAKSGVNTILRVATNKTFDCSSSLRVPQLNIQKYLPATGSTDLALGVQTPGTQIVITCSMGMYSSTISFI